MISNLKSCARALGGGGIALAFAGAAFAQAETPTAAMVGDSVANQVVVRDAQTGKLRAASVQEARALTAERAAAPSGQPLNTAPRLHASGARGVRLSDEFMNHAVIARLPDGSVVEQCFHTPEEAAIAHKSMSIKKAPAALPTE
jgi:hypothetical protein